MKGSLRGAAASWAREVVSGDMSGHCDSAPAEEMLTGAPNAQLLAASLSAMMSSIRSRIDRMEPGALPAGIRGFGRPTTRIADRPKAPQFLATSCAR